MRQPSSHKMASLRKLTHLKKASLSSELSAMRVQLSAKEEDINALKRKQATAQNFDELTVAERWRRWKEKELRRLNAEYALLRIEYDQFARIVGRAVAEDAVVDRLYSDAKGAEKTLLRRRSELSALHLLPHDVCDQDI